MQPTKMNHQPRKKPLEMLADLFSGRFIKIFERYEKKYSQNQKLKIFWTIMALYTCMLAYLVYDVFSKPSDLMKKQVPAASSAFEVKKDPPFEQSVNDLKDQQTGNQKEKEKKSTKKQSLP